MRIYGKDFDYTRTREARMGDIHYAKREPYLEVGKMSLNAVVYCDCVEQGRVTIPHPRPDLLFIDETGSHPGISSDDPGDIEAHDPRESLRPCEHERFWLIERWLGNISLIETIRSLLKQQSSNPARDYPVLF